MTAWHCIPTVIYMQFRFTSPLSDYTQWESDDDRDRCVWYYKTEKPLPSPDKLGTSLPCTYSSNECSAARSSVGLQESRSFDAVGVPDQGVLLQTET